MPTLKYIDVIVEAVVDVGHSVQVMVKIDYEGNFALPANASVRGKPIRPHLAQPRALDSNGNPRFDVYLFELLSKSDKDCFELGNVVPLLVDIAPQETDFEE